MKIIPIVPMRKADADRIVGGLTQTSKMPCKSYSLPTLACQTGFKLAQIAGSVCSECYANKGFYSMYAATIEPAQMARWDSVMQACETSDDARAWIDAMVRLIGDDEYFRWHDSGDLQSVHHLNLIVLVARATPGTRHWLPTREYGMVRDWIAAFGALPENLTVRLSAMYFDKPVTVPASLRDVPGVAVSNVHKTSAPIGQACVAPSQNGECRDCRACWSSDVTISYKAH